MAYESLLTRYLFTGDQLLKKHLQSQLLESLLEPVYPYSPYQIMLSSPQSAMDSQDSLLLQYLMNSLGAMPLAKKRK